MQTHRQTDTSDTTYQQGLQAPECEAVLFCLVRQLNVGLPALVVPDQ